MNKGVRDNNVNVCRIKELCHLFEEYELLAYAGWFVFLWVRAGCLQIDITGILQWLVLISHALEAN